MSEKPKHSGLRPLGELDAVEPLAAVVLVLGVGWARQGQVQRRCIERAAGSASGRQQ